MSKFNANASPFIPSLYVPSHHKMQSNTSKQEYQNGSGKAKKKRLGHRQRQAKYNNQRNNANINSSNDDSLEEELYYAGLASKNTKGKQIHIDHLLKFNSPPRPSTQHYHTNRRRNNYSNHIELKGLSFINANYRFIVNPNGNYDQVIADPDHVLSSTDIDRVIVPSGDTCPICLSDEPSAPRMAECGHIFCLACILRYFDSTSHSDSDHKQNGEINYKKPKNYKQCPLCTEIIPSVDSTFPVLINPYDPRFDTPKEGEEVILRLMERKHDSILALPTSIHNNISNNKNKDIPFITDEIISYPRFLKSTNEFLVKEYQKEIKTIQDLAKNDALLYGEDSIAFSKDAIRLLKQEITQLKSLKNHYELNKILDDNSNKNNNDNNYYYYYETGFNTPTRYFLSPLDIKILKTTYGTYSNFPQIIHTKIIIIDHQISCDEFLKKKMKFLNHLPTGADISFLQCDWKNIIQNDIYETFKKDLFKRQSKANEKKLKEDIEKLKAEKEEEVKTRNFYNVDGVFSYSANNNFDDNNISNINDDYDWVPLTSNYDNDLLDNEFDSNDVLIGKGKEKDVSSSVGKYETTVWGTKILKASEPEETIHLSPEEAEERRTMSLLADLDLKAHNNLPQSGINSSTSKISRNGNENEGGRRKGKKKRLVLLSTNGGLL